MGDGPGVLSRVLGRRSSTHFTVQPRAFSSAVQAGSPRCKTARDAHSFPLVLDRIELHAHLFGCAIGLNARHLPLPMSCGSAARLAHIRTTSRSLPRGPKFS